MESALPAILNGVEGLTFTPLKVTPKNLEQSLGAAVMDITIPEQERRVGYALSLGLPGLGLLRDIAPPGSRVLVCGSGPSIKNTLNRIREARAQGHQIAAVNVTHELLIENGIRPDFALMLDPNERVAMYQTPTEGVRYLIGSNVHPAVWQRFREAGIRPFMFVPVCTDTQHEIIMTRFPNLDPLFIGGATTIGLRSINVMRFLGYQDIELHGLDSCRSPKSQTLYACHKPLIHDDAREITISSSLLGHQFTCVSNGAMSRQIAGFNSMIQSLNETETNGRIGGVKIIVAGDGAIPWMAWKDGGPDKGVDHLDRNRMLEKYGYARHWNYAEDKAA